MKSRLVLNENEPTKDQLRESIIYGRCRRGREIFQILHQFFDEFPHMQVCNTTKYRNSLQNIFVFTTMGFTSFLSCESKAGILTFFSIFKNQETHNFFDQVYSYIHGDKILSKMFCQQQEKRALQAIILTTSVTQEYAKMQTVAG